MRGYDRSRLALALAFAALTGVATAAVGQGITEDDLATLRKTAVVDNPEPPVMRPQGNTDLRQVRNYPEQPPVIPHKIEGYQVDASFNKCLTCHSRTAIGESQAPMISITHFMDRDGQFLASISPRRYFCNQCHVPQHEVRDPVENTFVDVDSLLQGGQ